MKTFREAGLTFLVVVILLAVSLFFGCDSDRQVTNPGQTGQLALNVIFSTPSGDFSKGKSDNGSPPSEGKPLVPAFRKQSLLAAIDRVAVSVVNRSQVTLVSRDLPIVETPEGRFAEGNLTIPINGEQETFFINVQAFDNSSVSFAGNTVVTLSAGETRETPLDIALLPLGTGDVQITLTWDTETDQDLHVIDPAGDRIFFGSRTSPSGGTLDFDNTSGFGPENIFWPPGQAPNGRYKVQVVYFSGVGVTNVAVVVTRSDAPTQTFNGTLAANGDTLNVTEFDFGG